MQHRDTANGPEPAPRLPHLAEELIRLTEEDRRAQPDPFGADPAAQLAYRRVTTRNGDRLAEVLAEHGWPGYSLVGAEASRRAWLVAQHADRQLQVQRQALRLMTQAVAAGEADRAQLAFLTDRVLVNEGHPQHYGTQIAGVVDDDEPVPWPCVDPERLDERRAEVGIEPFASHVERHRPGR
jgi:hypothetical protein